MKGGARDFNLLNLLINHNSKYGKLIFIFEDPIGLAPWQAVYQDTDKINILYIYIEESKDKVKIPQDDLVKEIVDEFKKNNIETDTIDTGDQVIKFVKDKHFKKAYAIIKTVISQYGKIISINETSTDETEIISVNKEIENDNYGLSLKTGVGDAGYSSFSNYFFFPDLQIVFNEEHEPLGGLFDYKYRIHPLQIKIEYGIKNKEYVYSQFPFYAKLYDLFKLIHRHFVVYDSENKMIDSLKIDKQLTQKVIIQLPEVDFDYIERKLYEAG
ncbi:MAG: hypothetical protein NZ822_03360, partial [Patescibacteria group bacterium]|nr:hypothetical protein [Patescibacteria group bacterium]